MRLGGDTEIGGCGGDDRVSAVSPAPHSATGAGLSSVFWTHKLKSNVSTLQEYQKPPMEESVEVAVVSFYVVGDS